MLNKNRTASRPPLPIIRGRDDFINTIKSLLGRPHSSVHLLVGSPGVGKTALLAQLSASLQIDQNWFIFAYSNRPDNPLFHYCIGSNCPSLNEVLGRLKEDILHNVTGASLRSRFRYSLARNNIKLDPVVRAISEIIQLQRQILIILDGLDEMAVDDLAIGRLGEISKQLPDSCHIIISTRPSLFLDHPNLTLLDQPLELSGLELSPFKELVRDLHIGGSDEKIAWLHERVNGLPLVPVLLSNTKGFDFDSISERDINEIIFEISLNILHEVKNSTKEKDSHIVRLVLAILSVLREPPTVQQLHRFLNFFHPIDCPSTPEVLWKLLLRNRLTVLFTNSRELDYGRKRVAFFNESLQQVLISHEFNYIDDLKRIHRKLADEFGSLLSAYESAHLVHHAIQGYKGELSDLDTWVRKVDWSYLLSKNIIDFSPTVYERLIGDIVLLFSILPRLTGYWLAHRILEAINQIQNRDSPIESIQLDELRRVAFNQVQRHHHRPALRIALDVWPGWHPFFAMEEKLNINGIELQITQGSAQKFELLFANQVDVIGTTPGCLSGIPLENLKRCRILGVVNRSSGSDQILGNRSAFERSENLAMAKSKFDRLKALVTRGSTSHLFLLCFLMQHKTPYDNVDIEFTDEYLGALKQALDYAQEIDLVSTWEPYASIVRHSHPRYEVLYDSSMGPGVIYDLLITERNRSTSLDANKYLGVMWNIIDDCIVTNKFLEENVIKQVCDKYNLRTDVYLESIHGVRFFDREQRRQCFSKSDENNEDYVEDIFLRVVSAWEFAGKCPAGYTNFAEWRRAIRDLCNVQPYWITDGDTRKIVPLQELPLKGQNSQQTAPIDAFVSYAWGDGSEIGIHRLEFVDKLCAAIEKSGYLVGRDRVQMKPGDSINAFATQISKAQHIIAIICEKSLHSEYCMVYELFRAHRRCDHKLEEFQEKVIAIIMDDARPLIKNPSKIAQYWKEKAVERRNELESDDPHHYSRESWDVLHDMEQMYPWIPDILKALTDINMPRTEAIANNNFQDIIKRLSN